MTPGCSSTSRPSVELQKHTGEARLVNKVSSGRGHLSSSVGIPEVSAICPFKGPACACVLVRVELLHCVAQPPHLHAPQFLGLHCPTVHYSRSWGLVNLSLSIVLHSNVLKCCSMQFTSRSVGRCRQMQALKGTVQSLRVQGSGGVAQAEEAQQSG